MQPRLTAGALIVLTALLASGCVTEPPAGAPAVSLLRSDTRALKYGATAGEVLDHPALRDQIGGLFGADWRSPAVGGGQLTTGAAAFFVRASPPELLRMDGSNYIAVAGCMPSACATHRALLLVREDGDLLLARVDEGGVSHYYARGAPATRAAVGPTVVDGAWRTLDRAAEWRRG